MILDIDNSSSVQSFVSKITSDWFDIDSIYYDLKSDLQTNWANFWNITDGMIDIISNCLQCTSEEFLQLWKKKCTEHGAMFMAFPEYGFAEELLSKTLTMLNSLINSIWNKEEPYEKLIQYWKNHALEFWQVFSCENEQRPTNQLSGQRETPVP